MEVVVSGAGKQGHNVNGDAGGVMPGKVWTPERRALHNQLAQLDPTLGALYGYMLNFMEEACSPGEERARMVPVAHAVREMAK